VFFPGKPAGADEALDAKSDPPFDFLTAPGSPGPGTFLFSLQNPAIEVAAQGPRRPAENADQHNKEGEKQRNPDRPDRVPN